MQSHQEKNILRAALDYAEGWYQGNTQQMQDALHPSLAKRALLKGEDSKYTLSEYTRELLVQRVAKNNAETYSDKAKRADAKLLSLVSNIASVRLDMDQWTDFMHLVEVDGQWKIINILWAPHTIA
jgi:Putative lumazine-binding